jgi:site-specific DNA recombinase
MADVIRKAFELIASGTWQVELLRKKLYNEGLKISKSNFYNLLRNPIYCGKIRIKASKNEDEEIVQGIHKSIISENLFYEVQNILDGRKKYKYKYATINETYPLRGHLICPRCEKELTGSSSLGNGGKYYYYHCTKGCQERHTSEVINNSFELWLKNISMKPEIASLYVKVIEDVFKTNDGDRDLEIKKLRKLIDENTVMMEKTTKKYISDELDRNDFQRMKESLTKERLGFESRIAELKVTESGFQEYCSYGFTLLGNMDEYFSAANV